jgi:hypothetical protein
MSVSRSNEGGTTFKFIASGGGAPQKRQQSQRACERCRKRKKRCHHTDAAPMPSAVSAHGTLNGHSTIRLSPTSTSPSNRSQAAPIGSQLGFGGQQVLRSSGTEGELQSETSPSISNPVERPNQDREPITGTRESTGIQVCMIPSSFLPIWTSHELWYMQIFHVLNVYSDVG